MGEEINCQYLCPRLENWKQGKDIQIREKGNRCLDDIDSAASFGLRFVIYKSLLSVKIVKLLPLKYWRIKLKILFTNVLFLPTTFFKLDDSYRTIINNWWNPN